MPKLGKSPNTDYSMHFLCQRNKHLAKMPTLANPPNDDLLKIILGL